MSLRDRMRFYKLRVTPDAGIKAASFNEQLKPELIPEQNDPFCVDWINDVEAESYYVGEKVRMTVVFGRGFLDSVWAGAETCRSRKAGVRREVADLGLQIQLEKLPLDGHDYRRHRNHTRDELARLPRY